MRVWFYPEAVLWLVFMVAVMPLVMLAAIPWRGLRDVPQILGGYADLWQEFWEKCGSSFVR